MVSPVAQCSRRGCNNRQVAKMDENDEKASRQLERLKLEHTHSMELLRATVAFEHAALKPPMLLNGGAVVVFLALFGALKAKSGDVSVIDENWVL